jgi:hypothetical protein
MMDPDIQDLALAQGIKDSLEEAGFDTGIPYLRKPLWTFLINLE